MNNKYRNIRHRVVEFGDRIQRKSRVSLQLILKQKSPIKWIQAIPKFFYGSKLKIYKKPNISSTDCAFLLINIHLNIRQFCRFTDHTIDKGPIFVTIFYILSHVLICPPLCYLYGFLGRYSERSYLGIWDMVPIFQGISATVCFYECLKMIETSIISSSVILMLINNYYTDQYMFEDTSKAREKLKCDYTRTLTADEAVDYGISRLFNEIGMNHNPTNTFLGLYLPRVYTIIGIWLFVLFLRYFTNRNWKMFIERVMPALILIWILALNIAALVNSHDYNLKFNYVKPGQPPHLSYHYLHLLAFSIVDYLPSNWITIGYLNDQALTRTQVIGTSILTAATGCGISFTVLFYLQDFAKVIGADIDCITSFGLHFYIVVIPYSIRYRCGYYLGLLCIHLYILIILFKTLSYCGTCHMLLLWAIEGWKRWTYRFRNLMALLTILILMMCSIMLCTPTVHILFLEIHYVASYHTTMILLFLTLAAIGIYGLVRLNGDYQFLDAKEYPYMIWLKCLMTFGTGVFLIYNLCLFFEYKRILEADLRSVIVLTVLLVPLFLGVIRTFVLHKKYHGNKFHPLETWGRADKASRIERRRRNLRQMFLRRTHRKCIHNCLSKSSFFETEILNELYFRKLLLDAIEDEYGNKDIQNRLTALSRLSRLSQCTQDKQVDAEPGVEVIIPCGSCQVEISENISEPEVKPKKFIMFKKLKKKQKITDEKDKQTKEPKLKKLKTKERKQK